MKARIYFLLLVTLGFFPYADQSAQPDLATLQAQAAKGDPQAELDLGAAYSLGKGVPKDFAKAADLYRKSAAQGNAKAMHDLGYIYLHGQGVPADVPTALQWFQKAADKGLPISELKLGLCYFFGEDGTKQDYAAALKWLSLAAQLHNPPTVVGPAANALGAIYEHGCGVPVDGKLAVEWYTKGAEVGHARAESNLARLYDEGNLVKKDPVQAYMWLKLSAFQGDIMATHLLPEYLAAKEFTPAQMAEGDRLAKEFQEKHHSAPITTFTLPATPTAPGQTIPAQH